MSEAVDTSGEHELDLGWMDQKGPWDTKAEESRYGLTLADIQIGEYGETPDVSDNLTGRPRGSAPRPGSYRIGNYAVRTKNEIWLDNASFLYEEALQRQWSSATDVPWHTIEPLPDDMEQAECQLATFFTEVEFVAGDVPARWVSETTPDFFEARQVLLAQVMDESRHMDVFRKRAMANGGGLMQATGATSGFVGSIDLSRDFTEMSSRLHLSGEGAVLTMFRMGELMAQNEAEKAMYRLCAQDEARHVAFRRDAHALHVRRSSRTQGRDPLLPRRGRGPDRLRRRQSRGPAAARWANPSPFCSAGGKDKFDEGMNMLTAIRRRQFREYKKRIVSAGFGERFENGRSRLMEMFEEAA